MNIERLRRLVVVFLSECRSHRGNSIFKPPSIVATTKLISSRFAEKVKEHVKKKEKLLFNLAENSMESSFPWLEIGGERPSLALFEDLEAPWGWLPSLHFPKSKLLSILFKVLYTHLQNTTNTQNTAWYRKYCFLSVIIF